MSRRSGVVLKPLAETPFCTIVIPCFNEEAHIESVLRAAARQRYPRELFEIFVVDGASLDRTCDIVRAIAAEDSRIVLLENPARLQAAAMNLGIRRARGDVIVRMDAHADYDEGYLAASVLALRKTGALNVGGAMRPKARTSFQAALCAALQSPLGVGGSACRDPSREGFVESVWCGAFRRETFELVGLFDPTARTNEDAELNQRILGRGGRIYQSRDIIGHYYPRSSLVALARQYFAYGEGRARTLCRHGRLASIRPVIPFVTVLFLTTLAVASTLSPGVLPAFSCAVAVYLLAALLEALRVSVRAGIGLMPAVFAIFPVMHFAHGTGFAVGLFRHYPRTRTTYEEPERLASR